MHPSVLSFSIDKAMQLENDGVGSETELAEGLLNKVSFLTILRQS